MTAPFDSATDNPPTAEQYLLPSNSTAPSLQLNAGLTSFTHIDLDINLKRLAVGMENNQVLLWSLEKHSAARVFYTPVLQPQAKPSHPVALDPQGRWLAYGVPGGVDDKTDLSKIFLFDLTTGKVVHLLGGLETRAQSLRFSPDGNYLAASLSDGYGLRLWSTHTWELIKRADPISLIPRDQQVKFNLENSSLPGLAFNPNESARVQIVMVGDSGIWCFGNAPDFNGVSCFPNSTETWIAADSAFNSVAFSPDGNRIAIGSRRPANILVFTLNDLEKPTVLIPPKNDKFQFLSQVAWSRNGRYIYAGGVFWLDGTDIEKPQNGIVRWDLKSNNSTHIYPAGTDTVMNITPLGPEGVIYATQDPVIDSINANLKSDDGSELLPLRSGHLDLRYWKEKNLRASPNGQVIAFKPFGESNYIQFDVAKGIIDDVAVPQFAFDSEYEASEATTLKHVRNVPANPADNRRPEFNGKPLPLEPKDISRDFAFLPSGKEFVWATSHSVSYVKSTGETKWEQKNKYEALRVILADNGRLAIVFIGNGLINWYLTENGQLLLTLFIAQQDAKEFDGSAVDWKWIAWTPEGFYSSSVAGEQLIGWLVNDVSDPKNPIYYDFGTFREIFYRPDVIKQVLNVYGTHNACAIANEHAGLKNTKFEDMLSTLLNNAPPSINLISPSTSDLLHPGDVDICFKLRAPATSTNFAEAVSVYASGSLLARVTSGLINNQLICKRVKIPDLSLMRRGFNFADPNSQPVSISLAVEGKIKSLRGVQQDFRSIPYEGDTPTQQPRLLGLFIGISEYDEKGLKLNYAEKDAIDMEKYWNNQQNHPYREVRITRIKGADATRDNILKALQELQAEAKNDDFVILYFAGHGGTLSGNNRYLFFTRTADTSNTEKLLENSVTDLDLNPALRNLKAGFKVVIVDTCRNLLALPNPAIQRVDYAALSAEVKQFWNAHAFFATGQKGFSEETAGNGVYTKAFLEGLRGSADYPVDDAISISEIGHFTFSTVNKLTQGRQKPILVTPDDLEEFKESPPIVTLK